MLTLADPCAAGCEAETGIKCTGCPPGSQCACQDRCSYPLLLFPVLPTRPIPASSRVRARFPCLCPCICRRIAKVHPAAAISSLYYYCPRHISVSFPAAPKDKPCPCPPIAHPECRVGVQLKPLRSYAARPPRHLRRWNSHGSAASQPRCLSSCLLLTCPAGILCLSPFRGSAASGAPTRASTPAPGVQGSAQEA